MGKIWAFLISLSSIYALVTGRAEQSTNKNEVLKERKQNVYQQSRGNNYNVQTIILKSSLTVYG